jgi:hypothetical protein
MLERMLEADLDELSSHGRTPIAQHLRECARCRAVADRLVRDTRTLARGVARGAFRPTEAPTRPRYVGPWNRSAAFVAAAAVLAVVAVRSSRREAGAPRVQSVAMRPVVMHPVAVAPLVSLRDTSPLPPADRAGHRSPATRRTVSASLADRSPRARDLGAATLPEAVKVEPTLATPVDRAVAVRPVRLDVAPRQSLGDGVAVDPPPGTRARIIPTDRPGITVVWLHQ